LVRETTFLLPKKFHRKKEGALGTNEKGCDVSALWKGDWTKERPFSAWPRHRRRGGEGDAYGRTSLTSGGEIAAARKERRKSIGWAEGT